MLIKIFTLKFSDSTEGFDDEALRSFMAGKQILSVQEKFFFKDGVPYWSVMVRYKPGAEHPPVKSLSDKTGTVDDYRLLLTDKSRPLFNLLRDWRNEKSKKDSVPPFIMFTNRQLAEIALKAPESLNQLSEVNGVGKAKLEKYGKEVIGIAQAFVKQQPVQAEKQADKTEKEAKPVKDVKEKAESPELFQ